LNCIAEPGADRHQYFLPPRNFFFHYLRLSSFRYFFGAESDMIEIKKEILDAMGFKKKVKITDIKKFTSNMATAL
jgi:hypothetical protein